LTLDAQIGKVLERSEPLHARLVGLIPGQDVPAQLVIVCDFDDEDGGDELPDVATTEDRKLLEKLPGQHQLLGWFLTSEHHQVRLAGSWVAQRDLTGLADAARLDGSQPLAETLAGLPQELHRVGEGALRSGALRISLVLFDQVCLKSRSDFIGRHERLINGPFPRDVVHHAAIIPRGRPRNESGHRAIPAARWAHADRAPDQRRCPGPARAAIAAGVSAAEVRMPTHQGWLVGVNAPGACRVAAASAGRPAQGRRGTRQCR
jgi:hypothetical protein